MHNQTRRENLFKDNFQQYHPYHVLNNSKLPVFAASTAGLLALSFIAKLHNYNFNAVDGNNFFVLLNSELFFSFYDNSNFLNLYKSIDLVLFFFLVVLVTIMTAWSRNLIAESSAGHHTVYVQRGLKYGMIIFLVSELMLFFPFFWAFFHGALSPSVAIGGIWPPESLEVLDPFMLPFVNTVVLLSSGVATVAAHRAIISGYHKIAADALYLAVIFGLFFSWLQFLEYGLTHYTINDGMFGSVFYMLTGLHGFHVIIGSVLLLIAYGRILNKNMSREHHVGFEVAAWYWHSVDVIWLGVFIFVYVWGI